MYTAIMASGKIKQWIDSIITLDNDCSIEDLQRSAMKFRPCFESLERNLQRNFRNVDQEVRTMCKRTNDVLSCTKPNECFSAGEVELFKKLVATLYKNSLEITRTVAENFEKLKPSFAQWQHRGQYEEAWQQTNTATNAILSNSQSESCKRLSGDSAANTANANGNLLIILSMIMCFLVASN